MGKQWIWKSTCKYLWSWSIFSTLRSKGIICTGCAVVYDSICKRTSHASEELNGAHRPETHKSSQQLHEMPDSLALFLDPACMLHPSHRIVLPEDRTEASATVNVLKKKSSCLAPESRIHNSFCFCSSTWLFSWSSSMIVAMPTRKQACFSSDCKNLWQLKFWLKYN